MAIETTMTIETIIVIKTIMAIKAIIIAIKTIIMAVKTVIAIKIDMTIKYQIKSIDSKIALLLAGTSFQICFWLAY